MVKFPKQHNNTLILTWNYIFARSAEIFHYFTKKLEKKILKRKSGKKIMIRVQFEFLFSFFPSHLSKNYFPPPHPGGGGLYCKIYTLEKVRIILQKKPHYGIHYPKNMAKMRKLALIFAQNLALRSFNILTWQNLSRTALLSILPWKFQIQYALSTLCPQ